MKEDLSRPTDAVQPAKEKPGYWAVLIPEIRYDETLPDKAKLLYAEISSLTGSTGYCYASNDYFMRLYGIGERTLQRHLKSLADAGYIRIVDGQGGKVLRKIYAGISPLSAYPAKNDGVTPPKMTGPPAKNDGDNNKEISKEDHPPKAPQGAEEVWDPEAWERFWRLYPKHKDKAKALKEWNRLKADRKLMREMSAALRAQIASEEWQRDNGRAIPYPCRWLSHRRWEDELTEIIPAAVETPREELPWI